MTRLNTLFDKLIEMPFEDVIQSIAGNTELAMPLPTRITRKVDGNQITEYVIEIACAGYPKDNIQVDIVGHELQIQIKKVDDTLPENVQLVRNSISRRAVQATWTLHSAADVDNITSEFVDGLLIIKVPFVQPKRKQIAVKVN